MGKEKFVRPLKQGLCNNCHWKETLIQPKDDKNNWTCIQSEVLCRQVVMCKEMNKSAIQSN